MSPLRTRPQELLPGFDPPKITLATRVYYPNAMLGKFKKQFEVVDLVRSFAKIQQNKANLLILNKLSTGAFH